MTFSFVVLTMMMMSLDVGLTFKGKTVTNACAWFSVALRPQKPKGSLGRGAQDGHLDFHRARPELCGGVSASRVVISERTRIDLTAVPKAGWLLMPQHCTAAS